MRAEASILFLGQASSTMRSKLASDTMNTVRMNESPIGMPLGKRMGAALPGSSQVDIGDIVRGSSRRLSKKSLLLGSCDDARL
jgi:hypothetical protein